MPPSELRQAEPPPQPQAYVVPAWEVRAGLQAMGGHPRPELLVLRAGVQEPDGLPGPAERMERKAHGTRIEKLRAATRTGNREAAVAWAQAMFPNGLGKPDHGPEYY